MLWSFLVDKRRWRSWRRLHNTRIEVPQWRPWRVCANFTESQGEDGDLLDLLAGGVVGLFAQGGQVGADRAERFHARYRTETPRDFLFELGHADIAFGLVIVERYPVIGNEAPHLARLPPQTPHQVIGKNFA